MLSKTTILLLAGLAVVSAQQCSITDFSVVGPYTSSPEQCDSNGCTWYLETRYADCETFCNSNGLECAAAHVVGEGLSFVGCSGAEAAGLTEIACAGDGVPKARFSRTCTCQSHDREYSPVTDGCKNQNTEVGDACLPVWDKAAIRCCSKDSSSNFCDSFCGGVSHILADYDTAVATCEAEGLRLCTRAEIDARDCCGTGCQFDGYQTWILESCDLSPTTDLEGKYTRLPVTNNWHHVDIAVQSDTSATWSNAANWNWALEVDPVTNELVAPNSPYGYRVVDVDRDGAGRVTGVRFLNELYEASPLRHLAGRYTRVPVTNNWHHVEITVQDDAAATWTNLAGRTWGLVVDTDAASGTLEVEAPNPANPYPETEVPLRKDADGTVTGVYFRNELYQLSPLSGLEGSFAHRPVDNLWHRVTITPDAINNATWSNDAGRSWTLEIDATTGGLITTDGPYGYQELTVQRDRAGRVTGVVFQNEVYYA